MKENNVELLEELETLKAENEALKENQKRQDAYIEMQNKEMEETKDTWRDGEAAWSDSRPVALIAGTAGEI